MTNSKQRQAVNLDPNILKAWGWALCDTLWELRDFDRLGVKQLKGSARGLVGAENFEQLYEKKKGLSTGTGNSLANYYSNYDCRYNTSGNYFKRQWLRFKGWWSNETAFYKYCKDREQYDQAKSCFYMGARSQEGQVAGRVNKLERHEFLKKLGWISSASVTENNLPLIAEKLGDSRFRAQYDVLKRPGLLRYLSKKLLRKRVVQNSNGGDFLGVLTAFFENNKPNTASPVEPKVENTAGQMTASLQKGLGNNKRAATLKNQLRRALNREKGKSPICTTPGVSLFWRNGLEQVAPPAQVTREELHPRPGK